MSRFVKSTKKSMAIIFTAFEEELRNFRTHEEVRVKAVVIPELVLAMYAS